MRRATRGGASATPSRGRSAASPRASSPTRRRRAASAGRARMKPPSRRTALSPSRLPPASTSGPPEEPRGSGAVCSIEPATRRPRGPRKPRPVADTRPKVVRSPRPPGLASASTGAPARRRVAGLPGDGLRVAGVDGDDRHVEVGVRPRHAALGRPPVGERDRHLVAAQHVRDGQHLAVGDDDARAAAPAAAEPDHRGADLFRRVGHRLLESFEYLVTCNLQVTLPSVVDGTNFGLEGAGSRLRAPIVTCRLGRQVTTRADPSPSMPG